MAYKNTIHFAAFYSCVLWDTIPGTMATHKMEFLLTTHPWDTGCGTCRRSQLHTYKLSPWYVCAVCVRGIDVEVARAIWLQASGYCW